MITKKYFALLIFFTSSITFAQVKQSNNVKYSVKTDSAGVQVRPFLFSIAQLHRNVE